MFNKDFKGYMTRIFLFWKSIIYELNSGMFQYYVNSVTSDCFFP